MSQISYNIELPEIKLRSKTFGAIISIGEELIWNNIQGQLIEFGEITIGNDNDDNEMIFLPGSFKIRIRLENIDYNTVCQELIRVSEDEISITLLENQTPRYVGRLSRKEDLDFDHFRRTIGFNFVDEYRTLSNKNDAEVWSAVVITLLNALKEIFGNAVPVKTSFDLKYEYLDAQNPNLSPTDTLLAFGMYKAILFGNTVTSIYPKYVDVLKAVLNNLGCIAVIGLNRQLLLTPRFYCGGRIVRVDRRDIQKDNFEQTFTKKFRGMVVFVFNVDYTYQRLTYGEVEYDGDSYRCPDEIEEIYFPLTGVLNFEYNNQHPGFCKHSMRIKTETTFDWIKFHSFRLKEPGSNSWSNTDSLLNHIAPKLWKILGQTRRKYKVTLLGTDYDYLTHFKFDWCSHVFRPLKLVYNFVNDTTEVTMVEDPTWEYPTNFDTSVMQETFITEG